MRRKPQRSLQGRIVASAIACATIPPVVLAVVLLATHRPDPSATAGLEDALLDHLARPAAGQAEAMLYRLRAVESAVLAMRRYSTELLASPEIYGGPQARTTQLGVAGQPPSPAEPTAPTPRPAPGFDNPIVYLKGADGAIRKVLDDGRSAVYFKARPTGAFSLNDKQRLFASAALDPLLEESSSTGIVGQSYLLTQDSLLRTYPYIDLAAFSADRDLSALPLFAWSTDKANERGVIWTAPYTSPLSGEWVVGCICGVQFGERLAAVVGCEVSLTKLQEAATLPLGPGSVAWLQRTDGTLLAGSAAAQDALGVRSLAAAGLPDATTDAKKILEESNLYLRGKTELSAPLAQLQSSDGDVIDAGGDMHLVGLPLPGTGIQLGALLQNPLAGNVQQVRQQTGSQLRAVLIALGVALIVGLLLALALAQLTGRAIAEPLRVLALRVREMSRSRAKVPVAIHDDTEVGAVADAVQELIDNAELR